MRSSLIMKKEIARLRKECFYQLKLQLNIECKIPDHDSVRLLSQFVEEMDISDLYKTYFRVRN